MAKWIVEADPIPGHPATVGAKSEKQIFMTDMAAKQYAREMFAKHYLVRVRSAPEIDPPIEIGQGQSHLWAHSDDEPWMPSPSGLSTA
jgi:hypothetical protein